MTTKPPLDEIREAFEKWAISNNYDIETRHKEKWLMDNPLNPYGDEITNHCFQAWRAALSHFPVLGDAKNTIYARKNAGNIRMEQKEQ